MRIVIAGDVQRPGQEINILRLFARLARVFLDLTGELPDVVTGPPLEWPRWLQGYEAGAFPALGGDDTLVVGFELPPCAKRHLPAWVDVRLHPIRFAGELYGIRSNLPHVDAVVAAHQVAVEGPGPSPVDATRYTEAVFCLQVHSDASLISGGRLVGWADVREQALRWAAPFERIHLIRHPLEPRSPWIAPMLAELRAVLCPLSAYEAMARHSHMATASSSTGVEAPHFGCEPTFLLRRPDAPPPVHLDDRELWREILT